MTRQTEHYDAVREQSEIARVASLAVHSHAAEMQRDLNHGLAHVATALAHLQPDCSPSVGAPEVRPAIAQLQAWLDRMGVGHEPSVEQAVLDTAPPLENEDAALIAAAQLADDNDALVATVERLYDNIDAALVVLQPPGSRRATADAVRILLNARAGDNPLPEPAQPTRSSLGYGFIPNDNGQFVPYDYIADRVETGPGVWLTRSTWLKRLDVTP